MNILIIHNRYKVRGGEEIVVETQQQLLTEQGHNVHTYIRDYSEIYGWRMGRIKSFFLALNNKKSYRDVSRILKECSIDKVIIHNIFPIISPSIFRALKKTEVEVIYYANNYRLLCPTGLFMRNGRPCEKCTGGLREFNCIAHKCEGTFFGSVAYAIRSFNARMGGYYNWGIDRVVALTSFQKQKFIQHGIDAQRIDVVENFALCQGLEVDNSSQRDGSVLFVGRFSFEKGFDLVFEVAKAFPNTIFKMAGAYNSSVLAKYDIPSNVKLLGQLNIEQLVSLYRTSTVMLMPTRVYEAYPLNIIEASVNMLPVVASRIGAVESIVEDKVTGLLFEPENINQIIETLNLVLSDQVMRLKLAQNGYHYFSRLNQRDRYISGLLRISSK